MNTTDKTVEQLKEELRIAEEALAEKARIVREQEREAKYAEQRAKREAEEKKITEAMLLALKPVYEALVAAGVKCTMHGVSIRTGPRDYSPDTIVSIEREEYSHSSFSFRSSYTGRLTIIVGDRYQNMLKVRYPQLKDGGHNVEKIVKTVCERLSTISAQEKAAAVKKTMQQTAEQFAAQVRVENGYKADDQSCVIRSKMDGHRMGGGRRYEYYSYDASPGKVYLMLGAGEYTPEEVKIILATFKKVNAAREAAKKGTV